MHICYMLTNFSGPSLSHITKETCIFKYNIKVWNFFKWNINIFNFTKIKWKLFWHFYSIQEETILNYWFIHFLHLKMNFWRWGENQTFARQLETKVFLNFNFLKTFLTFFFETFWTSNLRPLSLLSLKIFNVRFQYNLKRSRRL